MEIKLRSLIASFLFILIVSLSLEAHEGHHHPISSEDALFLSQNEIFISIMNWVAPFGRLHLVFLHFPIALIVMTVVAELLWILLKNPLFTHAARFMILAAAFLAPVTALLGFAFGYGQHYEGVSLDLFAWHRYFGFLTAALAVFTAFCRERSSSSMIYYASLFFLFLFVILTGFLGGSLTFGLDESL